MRTRYTLLLIFLVQLGHTQEWAPIGAEWYYSQIKFNPIFDKTEYNKLTCVGDTVIDGQLCRKVKWEVRFEDGSLADRDSYIYTYENSGRIYFYHEWVSQFQMAYDFNAKEGDTIKSEFGHQKVEYVIDSIRLLPNARDSIYAQYVTNINESWFYINRYVIVGVGNMEWIMPNYGAVDPPSGGHLFCYVENGRKLIGGAGECDYLNSTADQYLEVTISPNPANGHITINSNKRIGQTTIIDISGRKVSQEGTTITLIQSGINTLLIEFEDGTRAIRKVFNIGM